MNTQPTKQHNDNKENDKEQEVSKSENKSKVDTEAGVDSPDTVGYGTTLQPKEAIPAPKQITDSTNAVTLTSGRDASIITAVASLLNNPNVNREDVLKLLQTLNTSTSTQTAPDQVEIKTESVKIGLSDATITPTSTKIEYNVNVPKIVHHSQISLTPITGIPKNVTITGSGCVSSEAITLQSSRVKINDTKTAIDYTTTRVRISNDTYVDVPPIVKSFPRFLSFHYKALDSQQHPSVFIGVSHLASYLLHAGEPALNQPITRLSLILSPSFQEQCKGFKRYGTWECGMPLSNAQLINPRCMILPQKADPSVANTFSTPVSGIYEAMELVSGLVMFSIDAAKQFHVILMSEKIIIPSTSTLPLGAPVTVQNELSLPSECYSHPILSAVSESIKGSTRLSINAGIEEYGKMKIGKVATKLSNHANLALISTFWNFSDVLTARMLSSYFERSFQLGQDGGSIISALQASAFTPSEFQIIDSDPKSFYFGKMLNRDQECSNLIYALAANTGNVEKLLSLYSSILGSMGLISEQYNKPTHLRKYIQMQQDRDVRSQEVLSRASNVSSASLTQLISLMVMPELIYPNFDIPTPQSLIEGLYTLFAVCLSILFFPTVTLYAIPKIHNFMLYLIGLVDERSLLANHVLIRTRGDKDYRSSTQENLSIWISEGLRSAFFDPRFANTGGKITKILVKILQTAVVNNEILTDRTAQHADFPRLFRIDGSLCTNGGKMRPWPRRDLDTSEDALQTKIVAIAEMISTLVSSAAKNSNTNIKVSSTMSGIVTSVISALKNDALITAKALTGRITRMIENFPNLSTSIMYRDYHDYYQPIPPPLVLYDKDDTSRYVVIGSKSYAEGPTYSIFSAVGLTQNFLLFDEDQQSFGREAYQPFQMIAPNPLVVYATCSDFFQEARGAGKILSFTNYLYDAITKPEGRIRKLLEDFGYHVPKISASRYMNLFEFAAQVLGEGMTWFNKELNDATNVDGRNSLIVRILQPAIGELLDNTPCPLVRRNLPVIDNLFKIMDVDLINGFETIFDLMLDKSWVVNRLHQGLFITREHITLDSYQYYDPSELNPIDFDQNYFKQIRGAQISTICFVYDGVTYSDPHQFPRLTFKILPNTTISTMVLSLLNQGYSAGRFSFYLPEINYIWEFGDGEETAADLTQLLTYTKFKIFKITIPDRDIANYFATQELVVRAERSIFPVSDIFKCVIGTAFNVEGQMSDARELDTAIMESGYPLGQYGTGIKNEDGAIVEKPYNSVSMNNILPYVTPAAIIRDDTLVECSFSHGFSE